jgi:hypothetical protein
MPRAGFEPATPATERPQTYVLDHAAIGNGNYLVHLLRIWGWKSWVWFSTRRLALRNRGVLVFLSHFSKCRNSSFKYAASIHNFPMIHCHPHTLNDDRLFNDYVSLHFDDV